MTQQAPENPTENVAPSNGPEIDYDKLSKSVAENLKSLLPPATTPPAQQPSGNSDDALRVAVEAMPEKIVNSIKEAFVTPAAEQTPPPTNTPENPQEPGKPKSLGEWWFGK